MAYMQLFVVEGDGPFPLAMLKQDYCWPADSESVTDMRDPLGSRGYQTRKVHLYRLIAGWMPTVEISDKEWESFGWKVIHRDKPVRL